MMGVVVVEFISQTLDYLTLSLSCVGPPDIIASRWDRLLQYFTAASTDVIMFSKGILTTINTLREVSFCSIRYDILSYLILSWRGRLLAERKQNENDKSEITKKCCTLNSKIQKFHALKALENYLCDAVKDFSVWYLSGSTVLSNSSEINLFSLILNFIQLASIKQIN